MRRTGLMTVSALMSLFVLVGCEPKQAIQLRYDRPAEYEIGPTIQTLGIAEFGGATSADRKWGDIASDRVAAQLDTYNKKYQRYQLVDRKRLKAILDEQDLQAAFSDSSKAIEAGKIAHVDAMVYGSATVNLRDEHAVRSTFDPMSRSMKQVPYTKRYVMTAVSFTIDNVQTGTTLTTVATKREYDSENDTSGGKTKALTKMMGLGGGNLPAADQLVSDLIDQCVEEFVARISPHEIRVVERLRGGKSDAVKTGNKLTMAGDYAEAVEMYEAALREKPDDHEAAFDAGVACEAAGKLDKAEEYYDRAFKLKPEEQYVQARKRVRVESSPIAAPSGQSNTEYRPALDGRALQNVPSQPQEGD